MRGDGAGRWIGGWIENGWRPGQGDENELMGGEASSVGWSGTNGPVDDGKSVGAWG